MSASHLFRTLPPAEPDAKDGQSATAQLRTLLTGRIIPRREARKMHGNEPIVVAFVVWLTIAGLVVSRWHSILTGPGRARNFRRVYVVLSLPWLAICAPAIVGVLALSAGSHPSPSLLITRFSGSWFDALLGLYGLAIPALFFVVLWLARRNDSWSPNGS